MKRLTIHNPANLQVGHISATFLGDEYRELKEREEVQLVDVNDQDLIFAEVLNVWSGPLSHVPALLLEMSSDPLQRTFAGLHMHLVARRSAAEIQITQESIVSVLVLGPKQSTILRPTMNDLKAAR
tara:strand:+ start:3600 stop:3977 length:378 start_codon:yes stop_codon:yes gene_type:complete